MADTFKSLSDLVTLNDKNAVDYGANDILNDSPLLQKLAAGIASNGTLHKYLKQTGDPAVGFRSVNSGIDNKVSTDVLVSIALTLLDASDYSDIGEAIAYKDGPEAYVMREVRRKLKAAFFKVEQQVLNGVAGATYSTVAGDAAGFAGLADSYKLSGSGNISTQVINAGGSTANSCRSVYLIRTNDDGTDAQLVIGNSGNITVGETVPGPFVDGSGKHYMAYATPVIGWVGLQTGSNLSVVRIANIDGTAGHKVTDALIYSAMKKFPSNRQPNLIVMNRDSVEELRLSRTATNPTGFAAPRPTDVEGIEVVSTDALTSTEPVIS